MQVFLIDVLQPCSNVFAPTLSCLLCLSVEYSTFFVVVYIKQFQMNQDCQNLFYICFKAVVCLNDEGIPVCSMFSFCHNTTG